MPDGYREGSRDTTRYPVLYIMDSDGGGALRVVVPMFRLTHGAETSNLLIVGVSAVANAAAGTPPPGGLRQVDYTPPAYPPSDSANARLQKENPRSGGAPTFLRILREEVIPFIDQTYRTTPDRGILGASLTGMFVAYAPFEAPDLFSRYGMLSPSLWWDDGSIFRLEGVFARRNPPLPKMVYLSVGFNEWPDDISNVFRLVDLLCSGLKSGSRYQGLEVIAAINMDDFHLSPVHFARAIESLYPRSVDPRARTSIADIPGPARAFCGPRAKW